VQVQVYTNRASAPDKDTINDIVARYEAGDGLRDLAKDFGIAASRIRRYLKTRGVEVREQQDKPRQQPFCIRRGCEQHVKGNALYCSLRCANKSTRTSARTCAADGCDEPTFRSRTGSQWLRVPIASEGVYILNPLHL
jgi:hypothetical protein